MSTRLIAKRSSRAVAVALAVLAALAVAPGTIAASYPNSLAAAGDSITRAYNTGTFPYSDNPAGSWSTGTNTTVASLYRRLLAVNPAISGHNLNDAKSGAKVGDLAGQLGTAATQHVAAVTILIGANDVCTSSESTMTSVADFRARFTAALGAFRSASPATVVYVASIPNIYNLWSIFKGSSTARSVWSLFKVCQSMLANPTSTNQSDVDRRARVLQRERDFNAAMDQACAADSACRWDGGAVFNTTFVAVCFTH